MSNIVEQEWFCRYPWPTQVTFDRGNEFMGQAFKDMLTNDYGIKRKPITVRNPQVNAILDRINHVIANMIRTFNLEANYLDETDPWKGILSATAFAVRSTYHTTLKKSPGQLIFGRDMILNVKHEINWEYIKQQKQKKTKTMTGKIRKDFPMFIKYEIKSYSTEELKINMRYLMQAHMMY